MLDGEKDIIKRAIQGEALAFGLLYDHYQPQIYRFVYLKVSHREEAEDLTHQVFLNSWKRLGNYRHQGFPFSSWLYRIARNEIIDFYRTRKNRAYIEETADTEIGMEPLINSEIAEILDTTFEVELVKQAISKLRSTEQDVIIMRFVEDLSPREVADAIGRTPEAIRLIQHRAIKNLRKILKNEE
ncbi:MAG: sigma-70 family RNA polymerase sigma factor [Candidatus Wolfebacteria bacterium]|nr:sigma-70 family RNA polymerase sigma factor [Candidatus Wolfebacteria bacterium]